MPEFVCKLGTLNGDIVERVMHGDSETALRQDLAGQDYLVLSVRKKLGFNIPFLGRRRVSAAEFLVFNQELMALIRAGLPILGSLEMLIERRKNPVFKQALTEIEEQVRSGSSLSDAFAAQGDLFPALYSTALASGERSGEIANVLQRYVDYARTIAGVRRKIISASMYPAILVTVMLIVVYIMISYVFPNFTEFFSTMKADLPMPTVVLLAVSSWVSDNNLALVSALVGGSVIFFLWKNTSNGRRTVDRLIFRVPLLGEIFHQYAITRFTRTLGTLLAGGIPMVTSLQIASRTVGNSVFAEELQGACQRVREGESLWESLERTGLMGDMAVGMIKVGESSGAMTEMLDNVSEFYDAEIDQKIQTMVSLLEPVMLVVMAVMVAGLLLAIYLPLLNSFSSAQI